MTQPARDTEDDALAKLKLRYASGEISEEEFEHRLERLLAVDELPEELFESGTEREEASKEWDLER